MARGNPQLIPENVDWVATMLGLVPHGVQNPYVPSMSNALTGRHVGQASGMPGLSSGDSSYSNVNGVQQAGVNTGMMPMAISNNTLNFEQQQQLLQWDPNFIFSYPFADGYDFQSFTNSDPFS